MSSSNEATHGTNFKRASALFLIDKYSDIVYYYSIAKGCSHRKEEVMDTDDKVLRLRELFAELPRDRQYTEYKRFERIVMGKPAIKMSHPRHVGREWLFSDISEVVQYLRRNGYPKANRSNVYKALNGERKKVYGYTIWYD